MQIVDDILAHYGVRGMRWGIRNDRSSSSSPSTSTLTLVPKKKPAENLVPRTILEFKQPNKKLPPVKLSVPNSELAKYKDRSSIQLRVSNKTAETLKSGKQKKPLVITKTTVETPPVVPKGKKAPSKDAEEAAAIKEKAKSGKQVLTNDEIRALTNRQNLEIQYAKLNPRQKSLGEKFARAALKQAPAIGLSIAQVKYKDTKDPKIKRNLEMGEFFVKQMTPQKKK